MNPASAHALERPAAVSSGTGGRAQIGIVAMVPDPWDAPWMPRHHVMSRLARDFPVAWIEPARHWRELSQEEPRRGSDPPADASLLICDPTLPAFHRPAPLARAIYRKRVRSVAARLRRRGAERLVLYLWRPEFDLAVEARQWDLVCYHVDDEYTFSPDDPPVPEREARLLRRADQVFIHSPGLLEKKGHYNAHTELVPNGVDYDALSAPVEEPADLAGIPRPRVGYTGMVKRQLDWPMLAELAGRHPGWSFVFVGARSPHPELEPLWDRMQRMPNVHFLGSKPVHELACYPQHFDVCIMPYRQDGYTRHIYPMKLHEYLATGRPVVGTPIRTLRDFDGVIGLAEGVDAWSVRLREALDREANPDAAEGRQAVARAHDWDRLVEQIASTIESRVHGGRRERSAARRQRQGA